MTPLDPPEAPEFPTIRQAALCIALSASTMSAEISREAHQRNVGEFLDGRDPATLRLAETWLSGLSAPDLQTICCGDIDGQLVLLMRAPWHTDRLLAALFERD